IWRGPKPQADDARTPLGDGKELFTSSQARAVLENLQIARAHSGDEPKTLSSAELELWLDRYLRIFGLSWLDALRQQAKGLATRFGWDREYLELDQLVAAIKGEPSSYGFTTDFMRSRARGKPYDLERVTLFGTLQARLAAERFVELSKPPSSELENRAFWEAYFSNFIEGTKFTVEEARVIVYDREAAKALESLRPDDAHDIRETYRLIIDSNISGEIPGDTSHLLELLKRRHARMMTSRLTIQPGVFKKTNNEFGSRVFVAPELVTETLARGWPASRDLPSASARALYVLFLIAEVHPFNDGNGRISRLGMNAELEASGQARLIIPTSLRIDYLTVLEALTANRNSEPFVAFAHKLIEANSRMPFGSFDQSLAYFRKTGALDEQPQGLGLLPTLLEAKP
ncbi:MAG: Fic family protein, partial [Deltaproteobacteria bacterium]